MQATAGDNLSIYGLCLALAPITYSTWWDKQIMYISEQFGACNDSDLSINYNIYMSHTNNDRANRHTWFASCLKLCMKLVASEAASKPHSVCASALHPVRLMCVDCACGEGTMCTRGEWMILYINYRPGNMGARLPRGCVHACLHTHCHPDYHSNPATLPMDWPFPPSHMHPSWKLLSTVTMCASGMLCKAFLSKRMWMNGWYYILLYIW